MSDIVRHDHSIDLDCTDRCPAFTGHKPPIGWEVQPDPDDDPVPVHLQINRRAERRGVPRRKDEAALHYATQNLLAAACSFVESEPISTGARTADLYGAVALYRLAEREAR